MPLYTENPEHHEDLHNQKELSNMSQEDFMALFEPTHPSLPMRILRFFLFIVFLGPLKALLVAICFLLFFIAVLIIPYFRFLSPNARHFKIWAFQTVRPIIRLGLFGLGIIRINVNRPIDPEARTIVCNHLSLVETIIILQQFPVSYLAADWLARRLLIKQAAKVFDFYFVNRAKKQHGVEHLANLANDPSMMPVLVFPEGKVTNGDAILGFRTGAYVSETLVQPVTIRYRQWLCPRTMSTFTWNDNSFLMYCYQLFAIPFTTVDLDVLTPISCKGALKTPAERAVASQLQMANHLGVLATCRSNRELFAKGDNPMRDKVEEECAKRD